MDKFEVVGALKHLEQEFGRTPSIAEIAEQCNFRSTATIWKFLHEAADAGLIVERDGKFMSHEVARAYKQRG